MSLLSPSGRKPWQPSFTSRSKQQGQVSFSRDQEYPRISCAFHPDEKITNFCKNFECLLPLCPRCVKIHTEEHMKNGKDSGKVGTHGDFEIIGECFKFLEDQLAGVMKTAKAISEQAHHLINERKQRVTAWLMQLNDVKTTYQHAKKRLLEQLQRVFQEYEIELEERLQMEQITFSQEILSIQDSICFLIGGARKSVDSIYSAYALEHLIQFYSQEMFSFEDGIAKCQQQLGSFNNRVLDLHQDNTQLSNVRQCIRRFFDSGEDLGKNLAMATFNKLHSSPRADFDTRSENIQGLNRSQNRKVFGEVDALREPSIRMTSVKNSQLTPSRDTTGLKFGGIVGRLANSSHLRNLETPLDGFDLSKSRGRPRQQTL